MSALHRMLMISTCISGISRGDESSPQVRMSITAGSEIWVGQKIPVVAELLVPGYFADSPAFRLPQVPGILILPSVGSPVVSSEKIGDITYTVQRHEMAVFARTSGQVTIPSFEIRLAYKHQPLDRDPVEMVVETKEISFNAKQPPGSSADEGIITSSDLTVTESWNSEPKSHAKAGDAYVRTISWAASDVTGMAFPPFDAGHISGLGIYQGDAAVIDTSERGQPHGERTDTITYVCKSGGHFVIPAVTVRWWNPVEMEMKQVNFPARLFDVTVPPAPPVKFAVRMRRIWQSHWEVVCGSIAGISLLVWVIYFSRSSIIRLFKLLRPRRLAPLNPP